MMNHYFFTVNYEPQTSFITRQKVVDCNRIIFSYVVPTTEKVKTFSFENEVTDLQRLLLTNFVDEYLVAHYTLSTTFATATSNLKARIEDFVQLFGGKNCSYIALLDTTPDPNGLPLAKVQFITNQASGLTLDELSTIWGHTVSWSITPFEDVLDTYANALQSVQHTYDEYLFSQNLQQPKIIYNSRAFDYLLRDDIENCQWKNKGTLTDACYGTVDVEEFVNL